MQGTKHIGALLAATILIWVGMGMVDALGNSQLITSIAVLAAFGSTLSLWLVWGLNTIEEGKRAAQEQHKAKRSGDDARLALLLELLTDNERRALKQRLLDELAADGEALPLAALLDDSQRARSARS